MKSHLIPDHLMGTKPYVRTDDADAPVKARTPIWNPTKFERSDLAKDLAQDGIDLFELAPRLERQIWGGW